MGNFERIPRIRQETKPSFRNKFHENSHWLQFAVDSYQDETKLKNYKVISESINTNKVSGFAARTYDTGNEIVVAIR